MHAVVSPAPMSLVDAGGSEVVASGPSEGATQPELQIQEGASVKRTSVDCSSPQGGTGRASTLSHPLFRRAAERANACVFESSPKKEVPATGYAVDMGVVSPTVFESQPRSGIADAGMAMTSHAEAAKALIEGAADAVVFESKPQQRLADAHAGQLPIAPVGTSVFESQPTQSTADVAFERQAKGTSLASSAEQLIQAAAEHSNGENSSIVFESVPQPSRAEASSDAQPACAAQSTSVFENAPVNSRADVIYRTANATQSARESIEHAANSMDATSGNGGQSKNPKLGHAAEARKLIQNAASSHLEAENSKGFVFQNEPSASLAMARHGDDYASESEYETDDESEGLVKTA